MRLASLLSILALSLGGKAVLGANVVVFGDSWATGARTAFVDMFDRHNAGVTVDNRGVGGTFAQTWALTPNALRDAVTANPDATHVWLSLGGNDGIARLGIGQRPIEDIVDVTVGFLKMSLDPLFAMHPNIQVMVFGYEIIDLGPGLLCAVMGAALLPECDSEPRCMNGGPGLGGTYALQDAANMLARDYPNNVASLDVRGAMQEASRAIEPPFPNTAHFTPSEMMSDCIHPNYNGYSALLERTWTQYWSRFFPGKQPVGASALSNMTMATPPTETIDTTAQGLQVLDEAEYRRVAWGLGISPQKIDEVVAWHKNFTL